LITLGCSSILTPDLLDRFMMFVAFETCTFIKTGDYFASDDLDAVHEYLLGDPGYMGVEMYVVRRVDNREVPDANGNPIIRAFTRPVELKSNGA
jgi:hypothetical protein